MWCLIRFHWGVCHYFISRTIWWAWVSCWKTLWLRGEQWVRRRRSVKAPEYTCEGSDGEERREYGVRDMWGSACCSYIMLPPWFAALTFRTDIWMIIWNACLSLGNAASPSLFCEADTPGRGFSCYPAGGTMCVCFQPSTEKALYLLYSGPTGSPSVLRCGCFQCISWCGPLMIQW